MEYDICDINQSQKHHSSSPQNHQLLCVKVPQNPWTRMQLENDLNRNVTTPGHRLKSDVPL